MLEKQTFVLAVSGGVDSVVLLHMLAKKRTNNISYVVAHFDHGIREDSHEDAKLVERLADERGFVFELGQGTLGPKASEALAREKRYDFLRLVMQKHSAEKIVTGHHQDDVLETMIINLIRGTGPRGLMPMLQPSDILRPLLNKTKHDLYTYAKENNLKWREDSTNESDDYLRNYVRKHVMSKLLKQRKELLDIRACIGDIYYEADQLLRLATPRMNLLHRSSFVQLSYSVQREVIRAWLINMGIDRVDRKLLERVTMAAKTLPIGKKIDVDNALWLVSNPENVQIMKKDDSHAV